MWQVEAGLRSFGRTMPEEVNRAIADHISDYLFAPTEASRQHLLDGGITDGVFIMGKTIVDAVFQAKGTSARGSNILNELGARSKNFILATVHLTENMGDPTGLAGMLGACARPEWA